MSDELKHYGTPRHSGRYPWGSGDDPYQRNVSFLGSIEKLREKGMRDTDIARGMGMKTTEFRKRISLANSEIGAADAAEAFRLKQKGYSNSAIGRRMGKNESSVRLLLDPVLRQRRNATALNAQILKDAVDENGFIDVTAGTELHMGISYDRMKTAAALLKREGYEVHQIYFEQMGTGKNTNMQVLCKPGTTWGEAKKAANEARIKLVSDHYSEDGGETARKVEPPKSISSKRILIRYKEDGGEEKDGLVELRRGVPDLSLNKAKYAQVRIAVDDTHYIKGMAMHTDNIPPGVDIVFNTNKKKGTPMLGDPNNTVLKPMKTEDPDNPFGASIKRFDDQLIRAQRHYKDKDGNEQLSALNIVYEEGDWSKWSKSLASQMLSKQNPSLAKKQLDLSHNIAKDEFDEIMSLTNPTVRASLLNKFADQCDSDATHLQAAALPRQSTRAILPFPEVSEKEIYAPGYKDGEMVALVRYPHGGIFEIPTLTVNNKNRVAKNTLGEAIDAVGINAKVAERLSGADFDGDNVILIPIDKVSIKTSPPLEGLKNFHPKEQYKHYEGMHRMTSRETGLEMGKISNLITDMTIGGAKDDEICKAVKHSMVVIDAEKHYLNYRQSEIDNGIAELKTRYQGGPKKGAATLLSRSTSGTMIDQQKEKAPSKMTPDELAAYREGKMIYTPTGNTYQKGRVMKRTGEVRYTEKTRQEEVPRMMTVEDAFDLVSGTKDTTTRIESVYASYANSMKALAAQARKYARMDDDIPTSPSAKKVYAKEVMSLTAQLNLAKKNAPLERQAQLIANREVATKRYNNPNMDHEHLKRLKGMALDAARRKVGAHKKQIQITDREWEAINAGAVSKTTLRDIIANADSTRVRQLATPRTAKGLSAGKIASAKSMLSRGYTQADIAEALDISVPSLVKAIGLDQFP